jgi:hypothetical protein
MNRAIVCGGEKISLLGAAPKGVFLDQRCAAFADRSAE